MKLSELEKKGVKFVAIDRFTGRKALQGGICTSTGEVNGVSVFATDAQGDDRMFDRSVWRFERR